MSAVSPSSLRIGMDGRSLLERAGGTRRYSRNLLKALLELPSEDHYTVFLHRHPEPEDEWNRWLPQCLASKVRVQVISSSLNVFVRPFWERVRLPRQLRDGIDLFFSPQGACPKFSGPQVLTVHDVAFLKRPDLLPRRYSRYWRAALEAARSATIVLVPSETTRQDLLDVGFKPQQLVVTPEGVDGHLQIGDEGTFAPARRPGRDLVPSRPYVLWVGTLEPRKNVETLVEAMLRVNAQREAEVGLVIVGRKGWGPQLSGLPSWVQRFEGLSDPELARIYRGATVFAFPSWYEGFGLPVLEAMNLGVPVIASSAGALPEIVQGAGLLLAPGDVSAWAEGILGLIEDDSSRQELTRRGIKKAGEYSWRLTAELTSAAFHDAFEQARTHG